MCLDCLKLFDWGLLVDVPGVWMRLLLINPEPPASCHYALGGAGFRLWLKPVLRVRLWIPCVRCPLFESHLSPSQIPKQQVAAPFITPREGGSPLCGVLTLMAICYPLRCLNSKQGLIWSHPWRVATCWLPSPTFFSLSTFGKNMSNYFVCIGHVSQLTYMAVFDTWTCSMHSNLINSCRL